MSESSAVKLVIKCSDWSILLWLHLPEQLIEQSGQVEGTEGFQIGAGVAASVTARGEHVLGCEEHGLRLKGAVTLSGSGETPCPSIITKKPLFCLSMTLPSLKESSLVTYTSTRSIALRFRWNSALKSWPTVLISSKLEGAKAVEGSVHFSIFNLRT